MNLQELKTELLKLKDNLSYDFGENYCKYINLLIDFDNENQGKDNIYLYELSREYYDIYSEDDLSDLGIYENNIDRIRYFLNDTYQDDYYLINVYGNLENVNNDTIKDLIDYIVIEIDNYLK